MPTKDDEIWYNANKEYDSWYKVPEIMDNYQKWDIPLILEDTNKNNEFSNKHIEPDFYIGKRQT